MHDLIDSHGRRTAWLVVRLCAELGMRAHEAHDVTLAALTHDIGKLDVPVDVLDKPAALTGDERTLVERHCILGAKRLLAAAGDDDDESTTSAVAVALSHHEWWNGQGYPFGLNRLSIPRCARIVSVADVFDALASERPYKEAWSLERVVDHIASRRDTQFDPECADAMLAVARALPDDWATAAAQWMPASRVAIARPGAPVARGLPRPVMSGPF